MTKNKEIWLIPYAHLDTEWRWEFPTTIKKYIKNTLEENIYLFEKYPEYKFNFTGALRYAMMKEYYPDLFDKAKKYIKEDRWCIAGTCLDETDTLVPSIESMIRNILYGDRWAKNEFGKSSRDYMIPDCFGFPQNMPSVLRHCGINGFSTQKLSWGSAVGIPFEIGVWKGPDNAELVCALNPGSYVSRILIPVYKDPRRLGRLNKLGEKNGVWKSFQYFGVGDIGGAPKEKSVIQAIVSENHAKEYDPDLIIKQGSSSQFFNEMTEEEIKKLDTYTGDLLLINHSAGMLTSAAIMKRWMRKNEQLAHAAEVAAVTAQLIAGMPYPSEKIKSAWYRVIGNQMHDILPGTCTPIAYNYSYNDEIVALKTWTAILNDCAQEIAPLVKGNGDILLFNPLGQFREDIVDIELSNWDETKNTETTAMLDADGNALPTQITKNEQGKFLVTFIPKLKPFSWSRYSLSTSAPKNGNLQSLNTVKIVFSDNQYVLENINYKITVLKDGCIKSIFHKGLNKELLRSPLAYEFQREKPSLYPAWNMDWSDREKPPYLRIEKGGEVSIIENGPIRSTIKIMTKTEKSTFIKEIRLSYNSEIVEFIERINWREQECSLKMALHSNIESEEVTYNWESSRINRGLNNPKRFEMPSRLWVDISDKEWGISIIEESKYGYDHPQKDVLRLTLLYTPGVHKLRGFWDQQWQDWGEHTIRYGIYAHKGDFRSGTDAIARRFNQKIRSFAISEKEKSPVKLDIALLDINTPLSDQIGIIALKKAEDVDAIIFRVYERFGTAARTDIGFNFPIQDAKQVNGLEEVIKDVQFSGNKLTIDIEANGIKSYLIKLKTQPILNLVEYKEVQLEYNYRFIGTKMDTTAVFPEELVFEKIYAGMVPYKIEKSQENNVIQCKGQKITIPKGYNTVSFLICSENPSNVTFKWVGSDGTILKEDPVQVSAMLGYQGQWDTRLWKKKPKRHLKYKRDYIWINKCVGVEPGFINRERLEFYTTHSLKNGTTLLYEYGYMYSIQLEIPKDADALIIPNASRVFIIAMTAVKQPIRVKSTQLLMDKYDF